MVRCHETHAEAPHTNPQRNIIDHETHAEAPHSHAEAPHSDLQRIMIDHEAHAGRHGAGGVGKSGGVRGVGRLAQRGPGAEGGPKTADETAVAQSEVPSTKLVSPLFRV